ncbi:glycosyltransferase [Sphingomonas sp.]|uniref:glycosyltransferase n=1 Tax=Sphingomonas sp. TaxID=28214 RepID=UPI00286A1DDE|nr:glycosyltransferase [Sphingomonas sp.]
MRRLLYVTPPLHAPGRGGREMLANLHWQCLLDLLGKHAAMHVLNPAPISGLVSTIAGLHGEIDGATMAAGQTLIERLEREGIARLFLNGSNLGHLAKMVKQALPMVEVLTFFHNVETRFFLGALRQRPTPRALAILAANRAAERKAVRFSNRLIMLNARDAADVRRLHGRAGTDLLPMALGEPRAAIAGPPPEESDYLLFVGGGFYANKAGVRWFVREVMPNISLSLCIVGRGLEPLRAEYDGNPRVRVIGAVDDLVPWYRHAIAVIAPIFDGSGMKTKVAEALMHGKAIVGTREAFEGYEEASGVLGPWCEDRDGFIRALHAIEATPPLPFDPARRALYDSRYSADAARRRLASILAVNTPGAKS